MTVAERLGSRRAYHVAIGISVAALAIAVLAPAYVPFTDAPEHAAVMATLRHWGDPTYSAPYELVPLRSQYLLYHLVGALVTVITGDAAVANKVLIAAIAIAFPLSFRALLRAAGRDERLALFACLPFYSRPLAIGFLPFVASIPLLFYGLALVFRQASPRTRTRRRALGLAAVGLTLFYVHVSAWVLFVASATGLLLFAQLVEAPRGAPLATHAAKAVRSLLWLVPGGVAAVVWFLAGRITVEGSLTDAGEIGHMRLSRSLRALPLWVFDVWHAHGDEAAAIAWWAAFAVVVLASLRRGLGRMPITGVALRYVPFAATLATFLVTPYRVGAASMLNVRLAPALVLFALLPLRLPKRLPSALVLVALVAANVTGAVTALVESKRAVDLELGDFDALLAKIPRGGRLVTLNFDQSSRVTHVLPWLHAGSYHRVKSGGVAAFSFTELAHWPLHWRPGAEPPRKPVVWWELDPCLYRNGEDGAYYDAVLVRGTEDPFRDEPPGPVFREAARSGTFVLYLGDPAAPRWPEWSAADQGPCVPRADAEKAAATSP